MSKDVWVGIHDHANYAARWLDAASPYSWLRAFEASSDIALPYAFLKEKNISYEMNESVRGVSYKFFKSEFSSWINAIEELNPRIVFYNLCYYKKALDGVTKLKNKLKDSKHIIRVHHDVNYLKEQEGFIDTVLLCDVAIVPTDKQKKSLEEIGFSGNIHVLPFGIDFNEFSFSDIDLDNKSIDILSATNSHPARNQALLNKIFKSLSKKGFNVKNIYDRPRDELKEMLSNSKFFFLTSLTEASGSRVVLEAIKSGCIPIVLEECDTASDLLSELNLGFRVKSDLVLKMPEKKVKKSFATKKKIENQLIDIIEAKRDISKEPIASSLTNKFDYNYEVKKIKEILSLY